MWHREVQRTLIVALGQTPTHITALYRQAVAGLPEFQNVIECVCVCPAGNTEDVPVGVLRLTGEEPFPEWRGAFEQMLDGALRHISHLGHVANLAYLGVSLLRPDEIHVIILADLTTDWTRAVLPAVATSVRERITGTLTCYVDLTGLLVYLPSDESWKPADQSRPVTTSTGRPPNLSVLPPGHWFDRACFLLSSTNELGFVVGDQTILLDRAARILGLLTLSPLSRVVAEADLDTTLISLGVAVAQWPGPALVDLLSARWVIETTTALNTPSAVPPKITTEVSAVQLISGGKIAPPLILEQLMLLAPALPFSFGNTIPDPPWPWLLGDIPDRLDEIVRRWEEACTEAQTGLNALLNGLMARWLEEAQSWIREQAADLTPGCLPQLILKLEKVHHLLNDFVTGVLARLEEAESDLAEINSRCETWRQMFSPATANLPSSKLMMILLWGPHPFSWLRYRANCYKLKTTACEYAHLLRLQLSIRQSVQFYHLLLPFYRQLAAQWGNVLRNWEAFQQAMNQVEKSARMSNWQEALTALLEANAGPWTRDVIDYLYDHIPALEIPCAGKALGLLSAWAETEPGPAEIERRLLAYAADALSGPVNLPVDEALRLQLPDDTALTAWLATFIAQSLPFWPYDETQLPEPERTQSRLVTRLLLPGGASSALAGSCRAMVAPPVILTGDDPDEIIALSMRQGIAGNFPSKLPEAFLLPLLFSGGYDEQQQLE